MSKKHPICSYVPMSKKDICPYVPLSKNKQS